MELMYYCNDCTCGLCPDCAVFDTHHQSHHVEKLSTVYQSHLKTIRGYTNKLHERLSVYNHLQKRLLRQSEIIGTEEERVLEMYHAVYETACETIRKQARVYLDLMGEFEHELQSESGKLESTIDTLDRKLGGASKVHIINNAVHIIELIENVNLF